MSIKQQPEILAPAGAREQLEAAVICGADAVYFGAGSLNARRAASNFEGDALREAVEYCHVHGVKVHLALNTVVFERELDEALALAQTACALGVDALIVQDLGLAAKLQSSAPRMALHASTQMAVHNLNGAKQLEQMGFTRVVLAREMSRDEIARVVTATTLETEVFVHGALCMCVSGQCYMSSMIGERSGNRGLCAQPCRLPFYGSEKGHCGLSLKDLSILEHIDELRDLGVCSVKIEGRMKRPEYVAAAVTACIEARDGKTPDTQRLRAVFSRSGFTSGYYDGKLGAELFGTRQKQDVVAAADVLSPLAELYRKEKPCIGLNVRFALKADEPACLTVRDDDGHEATAYAEEPPQAAREKPTTTEMAEQSLGKLGGTPYFIAELDADIAQGLCMPVSQINKLRRAVIDELTRQRAMPNAVPFASEPVATNTTVKNTVQADENKSEKTNKSTACNTPPAKPRIRVRFAEAKQIENCELDNIEYIILNVKEMLAFLANPKNSDFLPQLCVELPRIDFSDGGALQADLQLLYKGGVRHAAAGNIGSAYTAKQNGFTVHGAWALNVTNSAAIEAVKSLDCADICLSYELNLNDCKRMGGSLPRGILAYGHLPLMVVRNCPAQAEHGCSGCNGTAQMKDRIGNSVTVSCHGTRGITEIYNYVPLYLADRLPELYGLDFIELYFTHETAQECACVLTEYRTGGKREGITRGLYYRNVL